MASAKVAYIIAGLLSLSCSPGGWSSAAIAQSGAPAQPPAAQQSTAGRLVGAITAMDGKSLTIKPDTGAPTTVTLGDTVRVLRAAPGAKTLAGATPIAVTDLAVGDRVLVATHPAPDGSAVIATTVVAMKQADIAQQQQADQADWQKRGVGGLVKSVDTATGTITAAAGARTWTVHATPKTIVRRYSPDSVKFADAKPSTLDQIHPGDQLRARGDHAPDTTDVTADEIVTGSFRNIAATVVSTDPAANTVTVTDLASKKPVVIHISADSQMHKLPAMMAQGLAARFKGGAGGGAGAGSASQGHPGGGAQAAGTSATVSSTDGGQGPRSGYGAGQGSGIGSGSGSGYGSGNGSGAGAGGGQRSGDLSQFLQRTPTVQLSDLHKGDAVMIVATQGTPDAATAVTLIAGVEPILTASPSASQSLFSASWSLGGGGATEGEGTQ